MRSWRAAAGLSLGSPSSVWLGVPGIAVISSRSVRQLGCTRRAGQILEFAWRLLEGRRRPLSPASHATVGTAASPGSASGGWGGVTCVGMAGDCPKVPRTPKVHPECWATFHFAPFSSSALAAFAPPSRGSAHRSWLSLAEVGCPAWGRPGAVLKSHGPLRFTRRCWANFQVCPLRSSAPRCI